METNEIAAIGYAIAMTVFALLTALLLSRWKSSYRSQLLALACGATALWGAVLTLQSLGYAAFPVIEVGVEWLRNLAWLVGLLAVMREIDRSRLAGGTAPRYGIIVLLFASVPFVYYVVTSADPAAVMSITAGGYLTSVLILSTTEQIYRNASVESRSGLHYICVAVAGIFIYDLILFVPHIAGTTVEPGYGAARGFVSGLFAAPLGLGIWRTFRLTFDVQAPRQFVFHSFALTAIGIYVVLTIMGHYYIRAYGGSWSDVASIVFVVAAIAVIAVLLVSASIRARVRVFLMKTFFRFKYDYRKEWLRFIATLSESGPEQMPATAVRAVAQIVNSPGGMVWAQEQQGEAYFPLGSWRCDMSSMSSVDHEAGLIRFLQDRQWIVDLEEMKRDPARYEDLQLEPWLLDDAQWWLIVPLLLGSRLFGFILLKKPRVVPTLNFEDHDLLRTVGRHVGAHIDQAEADKRLAESSQFGTYNRLTAFLMHDLSNLVAQQSLVVKNAERFRDNPKFVDDAINTIAHSVSRMKRLMEQLSSTSQSPATKKIDLREVLATAVERSQQRQPEPELDVGETTIWTQADPERLATVIEHLIRNAQDATKNDGRVSIRSDSANGMANITITDTGCGMSSEFIRERLFRPFDSTKGSQSMGIGAYQARNYVRTLGGQMEVTSEVGVGTTFSVRLPVNE